MLARRAAAALVRRRRHAVARAASTDPRPSAPSASPAAPARPPTRDLLQERRILLERYTPGQHRAVCPRCGGGSTQERSLAVRIDADGGAVWNCFRGTG